MSALCLELFSAKPQGADGGTDWDEGFFFPEQSHMRKKIYILGYFLNFLDEGGESGGS